MYIGGGVVLLIVIIVVVILLLRRLPVRLGQDWQRARQRIGAGVRLVRLGRRDVLRVEQIQHFPDGDLGYPLVEVVAQALEHSNSEHVGYIFRGRWVWAAAESVTHAE